MFQFDREIVVFLNQFACKSWALDQLVMLAANTDILKGGVVVALLWWIWFKRGPERRKNREIVIATLAGCFVALVVARALALALPFRVRPLADAAIGFVRPHGLVKTRLETWSAFPSDHAALFLGMAAGIWLVSRQLGILTFIYTLLAACLFRIYLGLHYPSDILVGGALGVGTVLLATRLRLRTVIARPALGFLRRRTALFYALAYLLTYEITTLFWGVRSAWKLFAVLFGHALS